MLCIGPSIIHCVLFQWRNAVFKNVLVTGPGQAKSPVQQGFGHKIIAAVDKNEVYFRCCLTMRCNLNGYIVL